MPAPDARAPTIVFGGTFDPPHVAHVAMALAALRALGAERLLVIPASINPQRVAHPPAPAEERLAMTRLAFEAEPRAEVLPIEIERAGPSYTIDTLRALATADPRPLRLLIGSDQALNLPTWREWHEVLRLAPPAIVVRPPHRHESLPAALAERCGGTAAAWAASILPLAPVEISATEARDALARGEAPTTIPPAVLAYIRRRGLYTQAR